MAAIFSKGKCVKIAQWTHFKRIIQQFNTFVHTCGSGGAKAPGHWTDINPQGSNKPQFDQDN